MQGVETADDSALLFCQCIRRTTLQRVGTAGDLAPLSLLHQCKGWEQLEIELCSFYSVTARSGNRR